MLSTEQIMLSIGARDNASNTAEEISRNFLNMGNDVSRSFSSIQMGLANIGQVTEGLMTSLTGKTAMESILGTSSKAETNKVLLNNMAETKKGAEELYSTVDKVTDSSLTSMQELIPALNVLNSATGATDKELINITDDVANFGASVLAQTGSVDLAQQAMMDLAKGYKGAFASLDQYGISEDALASKGFEEGDSLEEYMKAVSEIVGSTEELMQTNQGLDALIGKSFSRAGKKIGNEFLPIIKDVKRGFIDLDSEMGGAIASSILLGEAGIEVGTSWAWNLSTLVQGFKDVSDGLSLIINRTKQVEETAENAGNALNTISNASELSGLGGGAGALGNAGELAGDVSKKEKMADVGFDGITAMDAIRDSTKDARKEADDTLKELEILGKRKERIQEELDYAMDYGSNMYYTKPTKELPKHHQDMSNYFDDLINDDSLKNGKKSLEEIQASRTDNISAFDALIEANADERNRAGKLVGELDDLKEEEKKIQKGMDYTQSGFFDRLRMRKDAGVKENASDLLGGLKNLFKGTDDIAEVVDEAGDTAKALDGITDVAVGTEALATGATAVGATAPEIAGASAGVEATAVASTSLAGAFTSMIVPALAIAGVIAIMIPIVTGLAMEAMFFLNILEDFFASLNFGDVDLSKSIDGLKQLAEGLAWVAVAMLAVTAVNIATELAMVTSFFTGLTTPLGLAVDALKKVAEQLQGFSVVTIDANVVPNLENISKALGAVSSALGALTQLNITEGISNFVSWIFRFKDNVSALEQGKQDLINSAGIINSMKDDMPTIDTTVAEKMKATMEAVKSVADAINSLRDLRNGSNFDILGDIGNLFGGVDINQAFTDAKWDLIGAGQALQSFSDIPDIPEGIGDKVKKLGEAISSVSEAIGTLRKIRDDANWDSLWGSDSSEITTSISNAVSYLNTASTELGNLNIGDTINDDLITKMDSVKNAMSKISEIMTVFTTLSTMGEGGTIDTTAVTNAVTAVNTSATELSKIDGTILGEDPSGVLGTIKSALDSLKTTLSGTTGFSDSATGIGTQIVSGVKSGMSGLSSTVTSEVSTALDSAKPTANTHGKGIGSQAKSGLESTLKLADAVKTQVDYALQNMTSREQEFYDAGAKLGSAMSRGFESNRGQATGSPGKLAREIEKQMNYGLGFINGMIRPYFESSADLGNSMSAGFGNPQFTPSFGGDINGLNTSVSEPARGSGQQTTVIVSKGAVQVDARNKTEKEAQQIFISAIESFTPGGI